MGSPDEDPAAQWGDRHGPLTATPAGPPARPPQERTAAAFLGAMPAWDRKGNRVMPSTGDEAPPGWAGAQKCCLSTASASHPASHPPHSGTRPLATFAGKLLRGDFITCTSFALSCRRLERVCLDVSVESRTYWRGLACSPHVSAGGSRPQGRAWKPGCRPVDPARLGSPPGAPAHPIPSVPPDCPCSAPPPPAGLPGVGWVRTGEWLPSPRVEISPGVRG